MITLFNRGFMPVTSRLDSTVDKIFKDPFWDEMDSFFHKPISNYHLEKNEIKPIISVDTAGAAEEISKVKDNTRAAIASELAAKIYNLSVLSSDIEDAIHNTTRFLFMKESFEEERLKNTDYITSFIFQVRNIPSALFKALGGFSSNKINMLKLESYMLKGSFKATQFYVDIEGHPEDDNVKQAFEELGFFSKEVKILGYYPASGLRKD